MLWSLWFGYLLIQGKTFEGAVAQMTLQNSEDFTRQVGNYQGLLTFLEDVVCTVRFKRYFYAQMPAEFEGTGISTPLIEPPFPYDGNVTKFLYDGSLRSANIFYCDPEDSEKCIHLFSVTKLYEKLFKIELSSSHKEDAEEVPGRFLGVGTTPEEKDIVMNRSVPTEPK